MGDPVALFVMNDEVFVYQTIRDDGPPGSGVWGAPTTFYNSPGLINQDISAASLVTGTNFGAVLNNTGITGGLLYCGNGPPTANPIGVSGVGPIPNFFGTQTSQIFNGVSFQVGLRSQSPTIVSSPDGVTWTELDAAHRPTSTTENYGAIQFYKNYIYVQCGNLAKTVYTIYPFNMTTGLWETPFGALTVNIAGDYQNTYTNGLYPWPNGDFGILYNNGSNLPVYRLLVGASWGSEIPVIGGNYANSILDPSGELIHNTNYHTDDNTDQVDYCTVTHTGVVTSFGTIPACVNRSTGDGVGHMAIINSKLFVPRDDANDAFNAVWVATLGSGSFSKEHLPVPTREVGGGPTCTYMQGELPQPALLCPIGSTATINVPYTGMLLASGGAPPYTYEILS